MVTVGVRAMAGSLFDLFIGLMLNLHFKCHRKLHLLRSPIWQRHDQECEYIAWHRNRLGMLFASSIRHTLLPNMRTQLKTRTVLGGRHIGFTFQLMQAVIKKLKNSTAQKSTIVTT
jgi:hypothetical protein